MSVTIHTTKGDLKVELYCQQAPLACKNFLGLAAAGKYDQVPFHRVMKSFLIQGGDTTSQNGKGGETIYDAPFPCEFSPQLQHAKRGMLGMATKPKEPNSNLSQFYIIFAPQPHLDNTSTVFGCVIDGLDTLDVIEDVEVDARYKPADPLNIVEITIHANPFAVQEN